MNRLKTEIAKINLEKFEKQEYKSKKEKLKICLAISDYIRKIGDTKFAKLIGIPISSAKKYRLGTPMSNKLMKKVVGKIK